MRIRAHILCALSLLLCAGCRMTLDPAVDGPYKRYPRTRAVQKTCLIMVDGPETRTFTVQLYEYVVRVKRAVQAAARRAFQQHFTATKVVTGEAGPPRVRAGEEVLAHLSVKRCSFDPGFTAFDHDEVAIEIHTVFDNGRGSPLTHTVTGRGMQQTSERGTKEAAATLFGLAIIDAMDRLNEFVAQRRSYFASGL